MGVLHYTSSNSNISTISGKQVIRSGNDTRSYPLILQSPGTPQSRRMNRPLVDLSPGAEDSSPLRRKHQSSPRLTPPAPIKSVAGSDERPLAALPKAIRLPDRLPLDLDEDSEVSSSSFRFSKGTAATPSSSAASSIGSNGTNGSFSSNSSVSSSNPSTTDASSSPEHLKSSLKKSVASSPKTGTSSSRRSVNFESPEPPLSPPKATTSAESLRLKALALKQQRMAYDAYKQRVGLDKKSPSVEVVVPTASKESSSVNSAAKSRMPHQSPPEKSTTSAPRRISLSYTVNQQRLSHVLKKKQHQKAAADKTSRLTPSQIVTTKATTSPKKKASTAAKAAQPQQRIAAPLLPVVEDTRDQDLRRIHELERRLAEIVISKNQELQAIRDETKKQKKELDQQVRMELEKAAEEARARDLQLQENHRIIELLHKDTAKIRSMNLQVKKDCAKMRTNNRRLEQTLRSNKDYYDRLEDHHSRAKKSHDRLQTMCKYYGKRCKELKYEVDDVTRLALKERTLRGGYEKLYLGIVPKLVLGGDIELCKDIYERFQPLTEDNGWTRSVHPVPKLAVSSDTESESESSEEEY